MRTRIEEFTKHITEALSISDATSLTPFNGTIQNVLICGLGGSGIGGTIIAQIAAQDAKCPITINKDYKIPAFVNENTLVVCCSYSGNTEESLEMLEQAEAKNAVVACITSGGKLEEIAKEKNYNHIIIPGGHPPRGAFGFGFPPIFYILSHYKVISNDYITQFKNAVNTINTEETNIISEAQAATEKLFNKIPVIILMQIMKVLQFVFRQQINENSKMLCWHHAIPEMNHNELVGWTKKNEDLAVVIFRNDDDYFRTQKRMEVNKTVFEKYTSTIVELYSKGNTQLEKALYLVHLGDWISLLLGEKKGIDISEVDVIVHLKGELAKI